MDLYGWVFRRPFFTTILREQNKTYKHDFLNHFIVFETENEKQFQKRHFDVLWKHAIQQKFYDFFF